MQYLNIIKDNYKIFNRIITNLRVVYMTVSDDQHPQVFCFLIRLKWKGGGQLHSIRIFNLLITYNKYLAFSNILNWNYSKKFNFVQFNF